MMTCEAVPVDEASDTLTITDRFLALIAAPDLS
jgi:hypothetical protein